MKAPKVKFEVPPHQIEKIKRRARSLADQKISSVSRAVGRATLAIDRDAKKNTPVDTGRLRSSYDFSWKPGDLSSVIWNPVEYASEVEFGNNGRAGVFMLTKAFNTESQKLKAEIARIMKK